MHTRWKIACGVALMWLGTPVHADDAFDAMRLRWTTRLTGAPTLDRNAADVAGALRLQSDAAQRWLARMHNTGKGKGKGKVADDSGATGDGGGDAALWDDIAGFDDPVGLQASAAVTASAARLRQMALAYATPGAPSFHDARLLQQVLAGLDWLERLHYRAGLRGRGNWWDWQIGTPQHLLDALCLLDAEVSAGLRQRLLAAIDWYLPDPRTRQREGAAPGGAAIETGANLLDKSLVVILRGMLGRDAARIALGRDAIGPALDTVRSGDGMYRDGSFIQHGYIAYSGSYGAVALADFARLQYLLSGSAWPLANARLSHVYRWVRDGYLPLIVGGAMPDAVRGRKISASDQSDHGVGRGVIGTLALLAESAPADDRTALRAAIKGWMQRDRSFGANYLAAPGGAGVSSVPLYELGLLKSVAADAALMAAPETRQSRIYVFMDRAVLRGSGFAAVLSLTSPRTSAFEFGNGENSKAWWTGMGMLTLYDADQSQYGGGYWATADSWRLPGITTDHSGSGLPVEWKQYPNPQPWVGGVVLGDAAAVGMAFSMRDVTGSSLHGKKSWFLLGQRIIALGADIGGGEGEGIETMVAYRRLAQPAAARLLIDGQAAAVGRRAVAHWAWLDDSATGSRTGYLFPGGAMLDAARIDRKGSWSELTRQGSHDVLGATYQSLALPLTNAAYAYVMLPGADQAATRAAASDPGFTIEANDARVAAVSAMDASASGFAHTYLANLWQAGVAQRAGLPYVEASGPASVALREEGGRLKLAVADPTQLQTVLELTWARPVAAMLSGSPGVRVLATAPRLRLHIDVAASAGAAFEAEFSLPPQ